MKYFLLIFTISAIFTTQYIHAGEITGSDAREGQSTLLAQSGNDENPFPEVEAFVQKLLGSENFGRLSGNFQIDVQSYTQDSTIGAIEVPKEKVLSNSFLNLIYNLGSFEVGLRYEAYLNPILGFNESYQGSGIAYRYATYKSELLDVTAGDFYEQFGSGLIFRAYEERQLGFDNAMDGLRVKFRPLGGIEITGVIGTQRSFWDKGKGIVRGGDANIVLNDLLEGTLPDNLRFTLGGGLISKYESESSTDYNLPANVLAYTGRLGVSGDMFNVDAEYAYKINDPNATNKFNFNPGKGLIVTASFFDEGIGATLGLHQVDNMDFRSERNALGNNLNLAFIPPLTKQQIYRLATLYPYATQLNGEIGYQAELTYKFPKGSFLGGEYGTEISFNHSSVNALDTTHTEIDTVTGYAFKYDSPFLKFGKTLYFRDFHFEMDKRWSKELKTNLTYVNFKYNRDVLENEGAPRYGFVNGNLIIGDVNYKLSKNNSLRIEVEYLMTEQDSSFKEKDFSYGNWLMMLAEYTVAPHFYFSLWDEYNYFDETNASGTHHSRDLHYLSGSVAYVNDATRVSLSYGRQRGGLLCVGGVCRPVPASNGFFLSITSSF